MDTQTTGAADRQAITTQINNLDLLINRLNKWNTAVEIRNGSIMLSGHAANKKEFHELLAWNQATPVPLDRMKEFITGYTADLLKIRNELLKRLTDPNDPDPDPSLQEIRTAHCPRCSRITVQDRLIFPGSTAVWNCRECEWILDK